MKSIINQIIFGEIKSRPQSYQQQVTINKIFSFFLDENVNYFHFAEPTSESPTPGNHNKKIFLIHYMKFDLQLYYYLVKFRVNN